MNGANRGPQEGPPSERVRAVLAGLEPVGGWTEAWAGLRLTFRAYVGGDEPPRRLVGSVRAIVCRGEAVAVVDEGTGVGLVAGGRPDPGEPLERALVREVLEETGWRVRPGPVLGVVHARRLDPALPVSPGWNRPDPDFLDPISATEALTHEPGALHAGEKPARFVPVAEARAMVGPLLQTFLDRALASASAVAGSRWPAEVILLAVRWSPCATHCPPPA